MHVSVLCVHIQTSEHMSHYQLNHLQVTLFIWSQLSFSLTWTFGQEFEKQSSSLVLLIPNNVPRIVVKPQMKKRQNRFVKSVPALMAVTTCHFYPHCTRRGIPQNDWAHMVSIIIQWNSTKSKVGKYSSNLGSSSSWVWRKFRGSHF